MAQQAEIPEHVKKLSASKHKLSEARGRQQTVYSNLYMVWVSLGLIDFVRCS
jgi:hypothetical protein